MKVSLAYVVMQRHPTNPKKRYYYFRKDGKIWGALKGLPGTREFADSYDAYMAKHAPEVLRLARPRGEQGRGTIGWAIQAFMTDMQTSPWATCSESTRDVYRRHFDWLRENLGDVMLNAVDEDAVRAIRDKRKAHPSVANMTVAKLGQVWDWAKEYANLTGEAKLIGRNPTRDVADLKYDSQSAPAWSADLCTKFEAYPHPRMVTFYMLARYTGQRRGDCCAMKWADFDEQRRKIFVVQEKTGTKVWVPVHKRLFDYLVALPRESDFILTSPKGGAYRKTSVTNLVCGITAELGFKTEDERGYSPHGLRHLCGSALAEAGCTRDQIKAILGHLTDKQVAHYIEQANRTRMAEDGMAKLEAMHDLDAARNIDRSDTKITTLDQARRRKRAAQ